jgi:hypothetical protein
MANAAVSAVKKGCQLYKDIKGAAGNVKEVLDDLDKQFHDHHKDKPATQEQRKQLAEKKNQIIELNKKGGDTDDIYAEIGERLGEFFDAYNKCRTVLAEEEKYAKTHIYEGDSSLGKRALQRVLMKKKLEQMQVDLRELIVYQSPPELGSLWSDVNKMMEELGKQEEILIARKMRMEASDAARKARFMKALRADAYVGGFVLVLLLFTACMMAFIAHDAEHRYPGLMQHTNQYKLHELRKREILDYIEKSKKPTFEGPPEEEDDAE